MANRNIPTKKRLTDISKTPTGDDGEKMGALELSTSLLTKNA